MSVQLIQLKREMKKLSSQRQAAILQRFFKTGKGEYGEGDVFLGIKVPMLRKVSKKYKGLPLNDVLKLLKSRMHEHRLTALFILISKFVKGDTETKKKVFYAYLRNTQCVNNWDLVDLSAPNIIGAYLLDKPRKALYRLALSKNLWERRIAMLATFTFIRNNDFTDALKIATLLVDDTHDLMRKAVGWMLREVGNRDVQREEQFLKKHSLDMPRTMLRYAIEKFPEKERKAYLKK